MKKTITKIIKNEQGEDVEVQEEVEVVEDTETSTTENKEDSGNPVDKIKQGLSGNSTDNKTKEETKANNNQELNPIIEALKKEKADLLKEVMAKKAKLQEYEGIDPAEAKRLLDEKKQAEEKVKQEQIKQAEEKNDWEVLKKQMVEENEKQKQELQAQINSLSAELEQNKKERELLFVDNKFEESKYIKENLILSPSKTKALYGNYFDVENGVMVAYNAPKGSENRARLVDANGDNLNFDKAMERIISLDPDKEILLKSKVHLGSGGKPTVTGSEIYENSKPSLSGIDKIRRGLSNNEK